MCGERPRRCELRLPPPPWAELPPPRELRNILAHATLRPTHVRTFAPPSVHPSRARESSLGITFRGFPRRGGRCARISFFFYKTSHARVIYYDASGIAATIEWYIPPLNGVPLGPRSLSLVLGTETPLAAPFCFHFSESRGWFFRRGSASTSASFGPTNPDAYDLGRRPPARHTTA